MNINENTIWSLLLASGYLKVVKKYNKLYTLDLTNYEVKQMFETIVQDWFGQDTRSYKESINGI